MRSLKAGDIMLKNVVTANPEDVLAVARLKMMRLGIGGLPVVEGGKLVGIITHRDTILVGEKAMNLRVKDIMTTDVLTIGKETSLREIVLLMTKTGYQRLPVVEGGKLVGLVTQSCIIKALAESLR
jgi:CBS domain-containing protein